jgi:hypothetical protein
VEAVVSGAPRIPPREELVRDGIPPEVIAHFRERGEQLRAEAIAAFGRTFVHWLESLRPGHGGDLSFPTGPSR